MAKYLTQDYRIPFGIGANPILELEEQETIDSTVIGASAMSTFTTRFGKKHLSGIAGIADDWLVLLLEYNNQEKVMFYPRFVVDNIKSDAGVQKVNELEGRNIQVILQYGRPVGIKI